MAKYYQNEDGTFSLKKKKKADKDQIAVATSKYIQNANGTFTLLGNDEGIAPVKDDNTWFKAGAFSDGYQVGDVGKTILGTVGDTGVNILKGVTNLGEGIVDLGMYGASGISKILGADELSQNLKEQAQKSFTDRFYKGAEEAMDEYSILGRRSDEIMQGLGYVGGIIGTAGLGGAAGLGSAGATALTTGTTFASSMGGGMSEAYESGATDEEAVIYGAIAGAGEAISEMIFGGLGKSFKALGIGKGLSAADDMLAQKLSSKFTSQIAKNFVEYGVKAGAEGTEEILSGITSAVGKKLTYMSEEDLGQIIEDEKLLDQFIAGAITSGIAQSGYVPGMRSGSLREANETGRDFVSGLTANEQAVFDKEVETRMKEAEDAGKTLSKKDKSELYDEVREELETGSISIGRIESILGGETYNQFKSIEDQEAPLLKELEEVKNNKTLTDEQKGILIKSVQSKLDDLGTKTNKAQIREQLTKEISDLTVNDAFLQESYREKERAKQKLQIDPNQYTDENARKTVENARKGGVNNTNRARGVVERLAKLSEEKGIVFDLKTSKALAEVGIIVDGKTIDGYVEGNNITLNLNSRKAINTIVGHEITHVLESNPERYKALKDAMKEYIETVEGIGAWDTRLAEVTERYKNVKGAVYENELTSDLVGEYLFTNKKFVDSLSTKDMGLFKTIWNEVKYLAKTFKGTKEGRQLAKAERVFAEVYRTSGKATEQSKKMAVSKDIPEGYTTLEENAKLLYDYHVPNEFRSAIIEDSDIVAEEEFEVARHEIFRIATEARMEGKSLTFKGYAYSASHVFFYENYSETGFRVANIVSIDPVYSDTVGGVYNESANDRNGKGFSVGNEGIGDAEGVYLGGSSHDAKQGAGTGNVELSENGTPDGRSSNTGEDGRNSNVKFAISDEAPLNDGVFFDGKYLAKTFKGTKEGRQLAKAERVFAEVYRTSGKATEQSKKMAVSKDIPEDYTTLGDIEEIAYGNPVPKEFKSAIIKETDTIMYREFGVARHEIFRKATEARMKGQSLEFDDFVFSANHVFYYDNYSETGFRVNRVRAIEDVFDSDLEGRYNAGSKQGDSVEHSGSDGPTAYTEGYDAGRGLYARHGGTGSGNADILGNGTPDGKTADNEEAERTSGLKYSISDEAPLNDGVFFDGQGHARFGRQSAEAAEDIAPVVFVGPEAKTRENARKAIDSGILNHTNRTHEFVDMIAKISADKGVLFDFTNNEKLKESGFALDGKAVNGYVKDGSISLNIQSAKALNTVVGHEITHVLEGTELYMKLQEAVRAYAETKSEYASRLKDIESLYSSQFASDDEVKRNEKYRAELTADLVGDYLFTDEDFVRHLSTNKNLFQRIFDEIKYLCKIATAGSKEAKQLEKVKRAFERAYKESNRVDAKTGTNMKYHVSEVFSAEIDKVLNSEMESSGQVKARDFTPEYLVKNGAKDLPMLITQNHIKSIIYTKEEAKALGLSTSKGINYHGLGKELLIKAVDSMDSPAAVYKQSADNFIIISEVADAQGNTIIIPVKINGKGNYNNVYIDENHITSVYGKKNLQDYLERNGFEEVDIEKGTALNERVQYPNISNSFNNNIPQNQKNATEGKPSGGNNGNSKINLSLSEDAKETAPIGTYNVYGEDVALEEMASSDGITKYLKPYSDHQKENWRDSKSIIVYESDQQLSDFVEEALKNGQYNKKMHFGMIGDETAARVLQKTGIDIKDFNIVLYGSEVRKIINNSHGNAQKEANRGQRAITKEDVMLIPEIIGDPDDIVKGTGQYNGHDVIRFIKNINGRETVVTYVQTNKHDIRVQTMYAGQNKRSLAITPGDKNIFPHTSETFNGTASNNSIPQSAEKSTQNYSLDANFSEEAPMGTSSDDDIAPAPTRTKQRKWVKTAAESDVVDGAILPEDLDQEAITYQPISNKKTLESANAKLKRNGYDRSVQYFNSQFMNRKVNVEDIALGERLIEESLKRGDTKTASEIIQNVAILGTELGQKVQALSIIQKMTPSGQVRMLMKTVERGQNKGDKAFEGVEVTQDMIDKILAVYHEDGSYDQNELNAAVEEVKQDIADQMKVTKMDRANAWRYLSMLGNPKTHIRNMVSNVAMKGTMSVKNAVARTIESMAPVKNRTRTWESSTEEVKRFAAQTTEEMKGIITGENKYSETANIKSKRTLFPKLLQKVYDFNSEWLGKEDWWFSKSAFKNSFSEFLTANGIRTAEDIENNRELIEKGKLYATEQAQIATFQQYSWLANKIGEMERKNSVTQLAIGAILPFKKTPVNIAKTGLAYSPLGFAKTLTYDMAQVKKGNMEAGTMIDHLAQNITGTALTLVGYLFASMGILNGAGEDDKEGTYDYYLGEQSYSVNIGGATYSLSWLSPVAMPLFVGANAYEQLVEGQEWNGDVVVQTLAQTLDPLSEMSFLSSLDDVLSSYDSGIEKFAGIGETMLQSYVGQFVPTILSQTAATLDDKKRTTKVAGDSGFKMFDETINQLMYKIPGLRQLLEPSLDIWGNEIRQSENVLQRAFENFIAPYSRKDSIATEIDAELKDLYVQTGESSILPSTPYNYVNYDGEKYKMSAKEYTDFKSAYGQTALELLEDLFQTTAYRQAASEDRADMVDKVYEYARDEAKREYLAKEGVEYTNATEDGMEYYKENGIKEAISLDMTLDEYKVYKKNPAKLSFVNAVGGYDRYTAYSDALGEIEGDKNASGNTITGSRKRKVVEYINGLDIDYGEKLLLFKSQYTADDTYNTEIVEYLNSRTDISYHAMKEILELLDFTVGEDGTITW